MEDNEGGPNIYTVSKWRSKLNLAVPIYSKYINKRKRVCKQETDRTYLRYPSLYFAPEERRSAAGRVRLRATLLLST